MILREEIRLHYTVICAEVDNTMQDRTQHTSEQIQKSFPRTAPVAPVGPVQRRFGRLQMVAEKIAMVGMQSVLFPARLRPALLRLFGAKVGRDVRIAQKVFIGQPSNLNIEDGVLINIGTFIDCSAPVHLGEKVRIGYQGMIITGSHTAEDSVYRRKEGNHVRRPVTVERGCWIQSRSMIGPGVTMAEGCTLLAYGVLIENTQPNGEYCGIPAKRKRGLSIADDHNWPDVQDALTELRTASSFFATEAIH